MIDALIVQLVLTTEPEGPEEPTSPVMVESVQVTAPAPAGAALSTANVAAAPPPGALKPGLLPYGAGSVMTLESSVIAPLVQTNLPSTLEPVPTEFDAWANTVPLKSTFDPRVDEDPIAQNTLAAFAPLISTTLEPVFAVSADP